MPADRRDDGSGGDAAGGGGGGDGDAAGGGVPEDERPDPDDVARKVRLRRLSRQLKAGASLLLAAAAGTFLACVRRGDDKHRPTPAPNPTTDEISNLPAPPRPPAGSGGAPGTGGSGTGGADGSGGAPGHRREHKRGHVDRDEHRKGMPVPDNLLE